MAGVENRRLCNWMFVINNPEGILEPRQWPDVKAVVWQLEIGEEGTVHYQGYVEFKSAKYRNWITRTIEELSDAWLEGRRGTRNGALEYCTKDDTRLEGPYYFPSAASFAEANQQGARNDLNSAVDRIKRGATEAELIDDYPSQFVRYFRGFDRVRMAMPAVRRSPLTPITSIMYLGPSGTGKSHRLSVECSDQSLWFWMRPGKWWDGYNGQPGVVFDEIRDSWMPFSYLLKVLDNKPMTVEIKGGTKELLATNFRFSSNIHPKHWYRNVPEQKEWKKSPMYRRFKTIVYMLEPYQDLEEEVEDPMLWDDFQEEDPNEQDPVRDQRNPERVMFYVNNRK